MNLMIIPKVTVYILCKNYAAYISEAIDSVINQIFEDWELIIIDDGSDDESAEIVLEYCARYPDKFSCVINKKSLGLFKASNIALKKARGEYILRLDADDHLTEIALLSLFHRAEKSDFPSLVYGGYFYTNLAGELLGTENLSAGTKMLGSAFPPHGACTLIRKRLLSQMGGYDERVMSQDGWDLWFRGQGYASHAVVAAPIFYYRQHQKSLSSDKSRLLASRKNIFGNIANSRIASDWPNLAIIIPVSDYESSSDGIKEIIEKAKQVKASLSNKFITKLYINSPLERAEFLDKYDLDHSAYEYMQRVALENSNDHRAIIQSSLNSIRSSGETGVWCYTNINNTEWEIDDLVGSYNYLIASNFDQVVSVVEERSPIFKNTDLGLAILGEGKFDDRFSSLNQLFKFDGSFISGWCDSDGCSIFSKRLGYWEMNGHTKGNVL